MRAQVEATGEQAENVGERGEDALAGTQAVTDAVRDAIAQAIERVQGAEGVLILTDMFGGTPSNLGLTFLETNRVEVITGVNLPMLLKLAGLQTSSNLLSVAREMCDNGRNAIWVASDLLHAEAKT